MEYYIRLLVSHLPTNGFPGDKNKQAIKGKGSAIQNFIEHRIRPFGIDI